MWAFYLREGGRQREGELEGGQTHDTVRWEERWKVIPGGKGRRRKQRRSEESQQKEMWLETGEADMHLVRCALLWESFHSYDRQRERLWGAALFLSDTHTYWSHTSAFKNTNTYISAVKSDWFLSLGTCRDRKEVTVFIAYTQTHVSVISHTPRRKTCASDWINDTGMHHEGEYLSIYLCCVLPCREKKRYLFPEVSDLLGLLGLWMQLLHTLVCILSAVFLLIRINSLGILVI